MQTNSYVLLSLLHCPKLLRTWTCSSSSREKGRRLKFAHFTKSDRPFKRQHDLPRDTAEAAANSKGAVAWVSSVLQVARENGESWSVIKMATSNYQRPRYNVFRESRWSFNHELWVNCILDLHRTFHQRFTRVSYKGSIYEESKKFDMERTFHHPGGAVDQKAPQSKFKGNTSLHGCHVDRCA